jgi:hypothetical protein
MHRAFTLDCPKGKRTPIGYSALGPGQFTPGVWEDTAGAEAHQASAQTIRARLPPTKGHLMPRSIQA